MIPLPPVSTPAAGDEPLSLPYRLLLQTLAKSATGWAADTGTASRTANATYTAPVISNPPTQAEVQAIADAVQALSRTVKAVKDDLLAVGRFTA